MLLALDVGNSSISVGVFSVTPQSEQDPELICQFKISNKSYSSDEYALLIKDFLRQYDIDVYSSHDSSPSDRSLDAAVISSVVPALTDLLSDAAERLCGRSPLRIDRGIRTGFGIRINNPEQLGSDIVANVAGALHFAKPPFIILDMGTATTLTVVSTNVEVLGTIIIPGLKVSMAALSDSAALLGPVSLDYHDKLIGRDTESAVRSGVINGNVYMIDGFVRNLRELLQTNGCEDKLQLVATGGLAQRVIPYTRNKFTYYEHLTLYGLAYLYQKNNK